jgi:demethylmenaquinone methyltransferase/2-methoxy-6-polyprenyl-1,4-benzoquinol methylase
VLELACGTGLWTEQLAATGAEITAVDSAAETIAINRRRLGAAKVRYVQADVFDWQSKQPFDCVFFGFWLSHVPPDRFEAFWRSLGSHLKPEGRFFFVDNAHNPSSVPIDSRRSGGPAWRQTRQLGDGREFDIVKIFYQPEALAARLRDLGWQAEVRKTANHFLLAWGSRGGGGGSLE